MVLWEDITLYLILILTIRKGTLGNPQQSVNNDWNSRNLEAHFSRLGSRLDQLVLRFDHLDSRINRFTSLIQGRLDGVENSLSTTKLKMDLWGEELNRIDEQLTRKWKNMEAKLELLVPSIDSKLESKSTLMQRDNRRHNEHLTSLILGLSQRFDAKIETVVTAQQNQSSCRENTGYSQSYHNATKNLESKLDIIKLESILEGLSNRSEEIIKSNVAIGLIGTKVTNMFEDLSQRSDSIQIELKESTKLTNRTRQELVDTLRALTHGRLIRPSFTSSSSSTSGGGILTSSETMSAVIVEALTSVESMSSVLGRRLTELVRSMEGKFEIVSNTLNGFLDSCHRIQEGAPLIEEHIASILERILDGFDNTTRGSKEERNEVSNKLDLILSRDLNHCHVDIEDSSPVFMSNNTKSTTMNTTEDSSIISGTKRRRVGNIPMDDINGIRTAQILEQFQDLSEDEKKELWDSYFRNSGVPEDQVHR